MQQRGKLEVTHHRRRVKTGGLPGATSREAPIPSTPETSRPEEELSGLGVSPVKFTGTVAGRPVDVMIDSGSAEDFISLKAAERLGDEEGTVFLRHECVVGGWQQAGAELEDFGVQLRVGQHRERLQLHGLPVKGHEIILGPTVAA